MILEPKCSHIGELFTKIHRNKQRVKTLFCQNPDFVVWILATNGGQI